jgi:hypothetical protein
MEVNFMSVFKEMCDNLEIRFCPTTSYNPQRILLLRGNQVMGNMLRAFVLEKRDLYPNDPWNEFLQACVYGVRITYHATLQASTGQFVSGIDMIRDARFQAN